MEKVKQRNQYRKVEFIMNCTIYLRVGTEEQLKTESQEEICKKFAKENGLDIVGVYKDENYFLKKHENSALRQLMKDCKNTKIDKVIISDYDKLINTLFVNDEDPIMYMILNLGMLEFDLHLRGTKEVVSVNNSFGINEAVKKCKQYCKENFYKDIVRKRSYHLGMKRRKAV